MTQQVLIGLMAPKQYGKSSTARLIIEHAQNAGKTACEMSWAAPLKDACAALLNEPKCLFYGSDEDKNTPVASWGILSEELQSRFNKCPTDKLSARELLQVVGTEAFRNSLGKNIWVNLLMARLEKTNVNIVVISDCRFRNEIQAIKERGGKIVRLYRDICLPNSIPHSSELEMLSIEDTEFDYVISAAQNKDMGTLNNTVLEMLKSWKLV